MTTAKHDTHIRSVDPPIKPSGFLSLPAELRIKVYQYVAEDTWTKSRSVAGLILSNHQVKAEYEHERAKVASKVITVIQQKVEKVLQVQTTTFNEIRLPNGLDLKNFRIGIPRLEDFEDRDPSSHFTQWRSTPGNWKKLKMIIHIMVQHLPSFGTYFYQVGELSPRSRRNYCPRTCANELLQAIGPGPLVQGHKKWHHAIHGKLDGPMDIVEYIQPKPWFRDDSIPCQVCEEVAKVCA